MSGVAVPLLTSMTYPSGQTVTGQYYLEYTGAEACQAGLYYFGQPPNPQYRILLRDYSNQERWLPQSARLRDQGVSANMTLFLLIPPPSATPSTRPPAPSTSQPTFRFTPQTTLTTPPSQQPTFRFTPQSSMIRPSSSDPPPPSPSFAARAPFRPPPSSTDNVYAPVPNTYGDNVVNPRFDQPIDRFYVQLTDYERLQKIGSGAFGGVYSARHLRSGTLVAVKELFPDRTDPKQRESYTREVQMLATLRHPAILTLHGCTPFDVGDGPSIITPLMKASVQTYIDAEQRGSPPACWTPTQKHIVLLGIASGMAFMHKQRCIHRDLKPGNVLLDENCEPRIGDFGLSKFVEKGATLSQSMRGGTPQFMAPEIHLGEDFGFEVDVYAFAMIMFIVLTGLDPYPDCRNQIILARRVANGERPTVPDHVSPAYAELIQQCWQTAPAARPAFDEIVFRLGEEKCLGDVDVDAVKKYQARVCPPDLVPPTSIVFAERARKRPAAAARLPIDELKRLADAGDIRSLVQYGQKLESGDGIAQDRAAAVGYYRQAADRNDADGIVALGRCLRRGIGVSMDAKAAVALFRRAVEQKNPEGEYQLADCLRYEIGCFRDYAESARLVKLAADAGHGLAANMYGELLEGGIGVAKNIPESVKYYRMSSDLACPLGMFNLGDMYQHGKHVAQDVPEAIRLYKLAAESDIEQAFFALCELYQNGEGGVQADLARAVEAAKLSADRGHFRGLVQYAELLEAGTGVPRDHAQAEALFARAHAANNSSNQNNYAFALEMGKGCRKQLEKAVRYYRIAAENGNAVAMKNLGACYDFGTGVAKDSAEAARWFKKSADAGCALGCACYGEDLRLGDGVAQDFAEARRYLLKGAEMEERLCFGHLGRMYRNGEGVPQDYAEAINYFKKAVAKGLSWAMVDLGQMYEEGKGVPASLADAAGLYRKAADLGHTGGVEKLAGCFRDGRGVPRDVAEARRLFQRAKDLGSTTAGAALAALG